ncbi:MAG: tetratricopeptide repeat protein [Candidatus Scalinduaceae bacterium]
MRKLMELLIVLIFVVIFSGCAGMHYRTGESYLKQQKYPEAINSLETALEKNPGYPKAHTLLGIAYYKTEMYEQAISELKVAKELQISDKRARLFLGMAYLKYGKTDDTIIEWGSHLDISPYDNVSGILQKNITVLKSGEILPETVDLMTSSIETVIAQEDRISDVVPYYRVNRSFGYRHGYYHHGFFGCD